MHAQLSLLGEVTMRPTRHDLRLCPNDCGEPILWTRTEHGERLAVDARPDPDGNQAVWRDGLGRWCSRSLDGAGALAVAAYEHTYKPHVATCTARRPVQAAIPGLTVTVPVDAVNLVDLARVRRSRGRRRSIRRLT